jgi:CheY-like chemotaxis protein
MTRSQKVEQRRHSFSCVFRAMRAIAGFYGALRAVGGEFPRGRPMGSMSDLSCRHPRRGRRPGRRHLPGRQPHGRRVRAHLAGSIHDARRVLEHRKPDLAILDLGLPDGSGLDLLRQVREADLTGLPIDAALPVLVLTGRAGELDRIRGFERGADDFLAKPFSYGELRGRVHALLRRCRIRTSVARLRAGDLEVDPVSREVLLRGERVALSQKEFRAASRARGRAGPRLDQGRAAARRLGLPVHGRDEDA